MVKAVIKAVRRVSRFLLWFYILVIIFCCTYVSLKILLIFVLKMYGVDVIPETHAWESIPGIIEKYF